MMALQIIFVVLIYLLVGVFYALTYLIAYRPEKEATALGLTVLAWPVYIVIEIVLQIAYGIGSSVHYMNKKLITTIFRRTA